MGQSNTMTPNPALGQIFYKDAGGNFIAVDEDHPLPTSGGGTTGDISIAPGDVQIGAVEIKDGVGENRASVNDDKQLLVLDGAALYRLTEIRDFLDTVETVLGAIDGHVDGLEGKLDTLHADTDGLEGKLDTISAAIVDSRDPDGVATTNTDVVVDATAGGVVILAANNARKGFVVQNTSANNIRVAIGVNPAVDKGIQLKAGESLSMSAPYCPVGAIKAIREGATSGACAAIEVV